MSYGNKNVGNNSISIENGNPERLNIPEESLLIGN